MVQLLLTSPKGNQGTRYFPYSGYLGLTPVRVEGVVRTKLDNDGRTLLAKSLSVAVRCYESRIGRVSVLHSNILVEQAQTLWSKPDTHDYAELGEMEFPFRITLPPRALGFSTATFVDYRCIWRIEATIIHTPIVGVGTKQVKHFDLPFIRYDLPPHPPTQNTSSQPLLDRQTSKPRAPRIRYSVRTPTTPIGPMDLVSVGVHLSPVDPSVTIRSASVVVERRIQLREAVCAPPNTPDASSTATSPYPRRLKPPLATIIIIVFSNSFISRHYDIQ
ncbi:hypothetical protein ONZ45_g18194 [Pleurotus djamor]|nr:hypothetical protein ONZ45_g18194 [Pleurotus djamor]